MYFNARENIVCHKSFFRSCFLGVVFDHFVIMILGSFQDKRNCGHTLESYIRSITFSQPSYANED